MDKSINKKLIKPKKKTQPKKKAQSQTRPKKRHGKLKRAQYDDLRQIEWVPFDPYAD